MIISKKTRRLASVVDRSEESEGPRSRGKQESEGWRMTSVDEGRSYLQRIEALDLSLFASVPSQTTEGCRRSLLAVQRAVARKFGRYVYLEIGSHLGGSIQPHLVDDRCTRIYSIDPRPRQQPDDRAPGTVITYEDNSSERMLRLLSEVGGARIAKIECIEQTTSQIDPGRMVPRPHLAFIDGEHTRKAVLSDFWFCHRVLAEGGAVLFHDFWIIEGVVQSIWRRLRGDRIGVVGLRLEGAVYGLFYDSALVGSDPYLSTMARRNLLFWPRLLAKRYLKRLLWPGFWTWQWEWRAKLGWVRTGPNVTAVPPPRSRG